MKTIKLENYINTVSPKFGDILLFLQAKGLLDNLIICGSLGLVLNNKLKRVVNDLDFLEIKSNYGNNIGLLSQEYGTDETSSCLFEVDGEKISCWKINIFNTKVEFLHNITSSVTDFEEVELIIQGDISVKVKLQQPETAIAFKKEYVKSPYLKRGHTKHNNDLIELNPNYVESVMIGTIDDLPW